MIFINQNWGGGGRAESRMRAAVRGEENSTGKGNYLGLGFLHLNGLLGLTTSIPM